MNVDDAQREMRTVYLGGFPGQVVSGVLWLTSAAVATWRSPVAGMWVLGLGGVLIFPATMLWLKLMKRRSSLRPDNPLRALATQIAFTVPLTIPVIVAATLYRQRFFYPAFMIVVGAHYLPFVFLYGMRHFYVLAALLTGGGIFLALYGPRPMALGGWLTGAMLILFAFVLRGAVSEEHIQRRFSHDSESS